MSVTNSFDILPEKNLTSNDILKQFEHYTETGMFDYDTAANMIDKILSPQKLDSAYTYMQTGLVNQILEGKINDALPYLQLMDHIAEIMVKKCNITYILDDCEKDDQLLQLKSLLFEANKEKLGNRIYKTLLNSAVSIFKKYARNANPKAFDENTVFEEITLPE